MVITSSDNSHIKELIKLKQKKYRDKTGTFLVEGLHLVLEAYKSGLVKEIILIKDEVLPLDIDIIYVSNDVMTKLSSLETPPTAIAWCQMLPENKALGQHILILDGIQDPGNLGTIIRSAKAFNIDSIILGEGTVDLYNPKVLRATQGMLFYINILDKPLIPMINILKKDHYLIYGTNVNNGIDVRTLDHEKKSKYALIVGNEGNGIREDIAKMVDNNLYITMHNQVESLNVGVATSILLYELNRG
jgi:RNA methyltransferase, TrmH family